MSHLMLVPSTACPAACAYCFGPHYDSVRMSDVLLQQTIAWVFKRQANEPIEVTFHGGEPLTAGIRFFRHALPLLREAGKDRQLRISVQSNLWLITPEYLDLFAEHHVYLGTSLDGPEDINDFQRGYGYFRRTMEKLNMVRQRGLSTGCITTLTAWSAPRWAEIIQFFEREGLDISLHAALPGLQNKGHDYALSPDDFGDVMSNIFAYSLNQDVRIHIEPIVSMYKGMANGGNGTCVFGECLGKFPAVGPDGYVYPCQRFIGFHEFRLGDLRDASSIQPEMSPAWGLMADWQRDVRDECGRCTFWDICHGGCPYNALVWGKGALCNGRRDPYCRAYYRLFSSILDRAAEEFFGEENLAAIVEDPSGAGGLFRHGNLFSRMTPRGPKSS